MYVLQPVAANLSIYHVHHLDATNSHQRSGGQDESLGSIPCRLPDGN